MKNNYLSKVFSFVLLSFIIFSSWFVYGIENEKGIKAVGNNEDSSNLVKLNIDEKDVQSNLISNQIIESRNIDTNAPTNGLVISNQFNAPGGTSAKFTDPTILQMSDAKSQIASIWSKEKLDLNRNFSLKSYVYLGDSLDKAGDGITFTLQNDKRMDSNPQSVIGSAGMGLGAYSSRAGQPFVEQALSIEFDTFYNNGATNSMDREVSENAGKGHVAVVKPKANNNNSRGEHSHVQYPSDYLSNGIWRSFTVNWDSVTKEMTYQLEGLEPMVVAINPIIEFGGDQVYWGFTASTGGSFAQNAIAISELPQNIEGKQDVTISNITQNTEAAIQQDAYPGDILEYHINNTFYPQGEYGSDWFNVVNFINLSPILDYIPGTASLNGSVLNDSELSVGDAYVTFPKIDLTRAEPTSESIFRVKVKEDALGPLDLTTFSVAQGSNYSLAGNTVGIHVNEALGKVRIQFLDENSEKISEDMIYQGVDGSAYNYTPSEFESYIYTGSNSNLSGFFKKNEEILITLNYKSRALRFIEAPINISFGDAISITNSVSNYPIVSMDNALVVEDTRKIKQKWTLTARMDQLLTSETNKTLPNALKYKKLGQVPEILGISSIIIDETINVDDQPVSLTNNWISNDEGLLLEISPGEAYPEEYTGSITWTLQDTP